MQNEARLIWHQTALHLYCALRLLRFRSYSETQFGVHFLVLHVVKSLLHQYLRIDVEVLRSGDQKLWYLRRLLLF